MNATDLILLGLCCAGMAAALIASKLARTIVLESFKHSFRETLITVRGGGDIWVEAYEKRRVVGSAGR